MPYSVEDAIKMGRDLHPSFTKQHTPDGILVTEINEYQHELLDLVLDRDEDAFITRYDATALLTTSFASGLAIPAGYHVEEGLEATVATEQRPRKIPIVPYGNRFTPGTGPMCAYIQSDTLFLIGIQSEWTWADGLTLSYTGAPDELTLAELLSDFWPERAKATFAAHAGMFMANRSPKDVNPPVSSTFYGRLAGRRESAFLRSYSQRHKARESYVQEVW